MNINPYRSYLRYYAYRPQWEAMFDEVRDLDKYQSNWDGEGANSVPLDLIHDTVLLLSSQEAEDYPAPACVYPLADGTVMVEWHYQDGAVDAANIRSGGRVEIVRRGPGAKPTFSSCSIREFIGSDPREASPHGVTPCVDDGFEFKLAT